MCLGPAGPKGSGGADFPRGRLLRLGLLHVDGGEIDRLEQERLEATVANRIGEHAAREREEQARGLCQQEGLDMLGRNVAQAEQPGIGQLHDEGDLAFGLGTHIDAEHERAKEDAAESAAADRAFYAEADARWIA